MKSIKLIENVWIDFIETINILILKCTLSIIDYIKSNVEYNNKKDTSFNQSINTFSKKSTQKWMLVNSKTNCKEMVKNMFFYSLFFIP